MGLDVARVHPLGQSLNHLPLADPSAPDSTMTTERRASRRDRMSVEQGFAQSGHLRLVGRLVDNVAQFR